jgi:predicted ATPase
LRFTRLALENWKNFREVNVPLRQRVFIVGPNAVGKSNLLDAFRFLRDIADREGGFQQAVQRKRDGVSAIRSLHARAQPIVAVEVGVELPGDERPWTYRLEFKQDSRKQPVVAREVVTHGDETVLARPDSADGDDASLLTQTHLEQVSRNKDFRPLQDSLASVRYLHVVPQLVREPDRSVGRPRDPFGGDFLEQVASLPEKTRRGRFTRIVRALRVAVPQLAKLKFEPDARGVPHVKGLYRHWRPEAGWQSEGQLSDGTLRLLGLLWSLLDGTGPLLLEEPEQSLHPGVVCHLPAMLARLSRNSGRQVLMSTHSSDLLADEGIAPEEVLALTPAAEGTEVKVASWLPEVVALLKGGLTVAEAVLPRTAPADAAQLSLFGD